MISEEPTPFIFLHIPKTAGSSIEQALVKAVFRVNGWEKLNHSIRQKHALPCDTHLQHEKLRWFEERECLDRFFIFTVVRNPYQRALSEIDYLRRAVGAFGAETWRENLIQLAECRGFINNHDIGSCQVDWLTTSEGQMRCDEIIRFEELPRGMNRVWSRIGVRQPPDLPHLNGSGRIQPWWEYFDPETAMMIGEKYARDFEVLGYPRELP